MRCRCLFSAARAALVGCILAVPVAAADPPVRARHRVTGLFSPDREADLRGAFEKLPGVKLIAVDYKRAEVTVEYVPKTAFPNAKPDQIVEQFNNKLRTASTHTFGVKPLSAVPEEKLRRVEIAVAGLDCKACSLALYEIVIRVEGVERATASFKDGLVTAWIDPARTDRTTLEDALKKRGVALAPR